MNRFIPLSIPNFDGNEKEYVNDALEQGWVSTGGAYIAKLEKMLAKFLDTDEVAACQSGTAGIHLALMEAGVMPEDMVLVPTLTFIAAVNPVRYQFATPVFMDCDDSLCIDPDKVRQFCEQECYVDGEVLVHNQSKKRVRALIVVHVFGNLADMEKLMEIADTYHLKVIEDATEALGSYYTEGVFAGKYAGTIGHFGAFSFNGNKIITTGGGGAVTARDQSAVEHMRYISTQAKDDPHYYIHHEVGYNYRMTNLQAALGVAQMEELPAFIKRKHVNFNAYQKEFKNFPLANLLEFRKGTYSNQWFYSLKINRECAAVDRNKLIELLQAEGIQTRAVWGLIHQQIPYQKEMAYKIECAPYYADCILNIPCSTQLTEEEIVYVSTYIKKTVQSLNEKR